VSCDYALDLAPLLELLVVQFIGAVNQYLGETT